MLEMEKFVFLYPLKDIVDFELERGSRLHHGKDLTLTQRENFKQRFLETMDDCIQSRYREKGFDISFIAFSDSELSPYIPIRDASEVIELDMDDKQYYLKLFNGEYPYADSNHVLDKIGYVDKLRIGGYHLWFSVDDLAKSAHEKGIETLVDEDMTELFAARMRHPDFQTAEYPSINPVKDLKGFHKEFYEKRKKRPWLHQYG